MTVKGYEYQYDTNPRKLKPEYSSKTRKETTKRKSTQTTIKQTAKKKVKGKSLEKTKKDIEGAIDKIIDSFEGLLDKFYQEKELDIATDISAMEVLMKQDGLTE